MTKPTAATFDAMRVISRREAADLFGVDPSRISQLIASGHIEPVGRGQMTLASVARGYVRYWQEKASSETKTSAESRVRDARAREIEMRNEERNRRLVPDDEAIAAIDHIVGACVETFNALPAMITRDIAERKRIEIVVRDAQRNVARRLSEAADLLRKGGQLPDLH